jgi:hypothetical protein
MATARLTPLGLGAGVVLAALAGGGGGVGAHVDEQRDGDPAASSPTRGDVDDRVIEVSVSRPGSMTSATMIAVGMEPDPLGAGVDDTRGRLAQG